MIEMIVDSVRVNLISPSRVVVLKECEGPRYLAIVIGTAEADAIAVKLQDRNVPRPLTHDLLRDVIETCGADVRHVAVTNLIEQTYYASIVIDLAGRELEVDSRPSDAVALAVRAGVSIYVEAQVLEQAGFEPDEADGDGEAAEGEQIPDEKLKVFREFIGQLDLDDFGRS